MMCYLETYFKGLLCHNVLLFFAKNLVKFFKQKF